MTSESREELISAYLDGELSDDERADVEKRLAESPELRQLHDELRALGKDLQSLERHQLDHDLSRAVLRRAEQAVLRGSQGEPVAGTIRPARGAPSWWNRGAGWRRVVWPAVAVAAALVILIYDAGRRGEEREVARAPEQLPPASELQDELSELNDEMPAQGAAAPELEARPAAGAEDQPEMAPQRRFRAAEGSREKAAPQNAAKPASPVPPGESAARRSELRAMPAQKSSDGRLGRADGIVREVTPEYLRDRTFEKLLDQKKIKWQRVAEKQRFAEKESRDDVADKDNEGLDRKIEANAYGFFKRADMMRATYVVEAPPAQVAEILAPFAQIAGEKVRRESELLRKLDAPSQSGAADAPRRVTITLVAPMQPKPAAAPGDNP